jgi:hypothetical protein
MTPGPSDVSNPVQRGLEKGLEAYFATDAITELLDAVDVEALLSGEGLEEPMEYEKMGELVGQMTGRLIVRNSVGRYTPGQAVEQFVGYAVGGVVGKQVGKQLERSQIERVLRDVARDVQDRPIDDFVRVPPGEPGDVDEFGEEPTDPVRIDIERVDEEDQSLDVRQDETDVEIDDEGDEDNGEEDAEAFRQDETDAEPDDTGDGPDTDDADE